jgi:hypothetical protein
MRFVGILIVSAAAVMLLTSCAGSTTAPIGSGVNCPQVIVTKSLVYPAPGSTGIPDSIASVVVAGPIGKVTLQPSVGLPVVSTSMVPVPSPIPSPNAAPVNPPTTAFAVPPLTASTTYAVIVQDTAALAACPEGGPQAVGSFTTQ